MYAYTLEDPEEFWIGHEPNDESVPKSVVVDPV